MHNHSQLIAFFGGIVAGIILSAIALGIAYTIINRLNQPDPPKGL